jgi:hypothetical protein
VSGCAKSNFPEQDSAVWADAFPRIDFVLAAWTLYHHDNSKMFNESAMDNYSYSIIQTIYSLFGLMSGLTAVFSASYSAVRFDIKA